MNKIIMLLSVLVCFIYLPAQANESYEAQVNTSQSLEVAYYQAARSGNIEVLRAFYDSGLATDVADSKGYTALILAAYNGQNDTVNFLLEEVKANPCQEDKRGNTALMGALFKGNLKIVKTLIAAQCDVNKSNGNGQTALMFAALFDRQQVIAELIAAGADVQAKDHAGNKVTDIALSQGNYTLAEALQIKLPIN